MSRRPRPKIVTLSDAAAGRVKDILSKSEDKYLRVGVEKGGCAGMEYKFDYAKAPEAHDELVEDKGVSILIRGDAVLFLLGSMIDFEQTKLSARFVFRNPNETDACGCGESVTIEPAKLDA